MNKSRQAKSRINRNIGRFALVCLVTLLFAFAIMAKLFKTTVIHADKWNAKAAAELNHVDTVPPLRGDILACDGSVLATNINVYDVRIDYRCERFAEERYKSAVDSLADSLATYFKHRTKQEWKQYLEEPLKVEKEVRKRAYPLLRGINFTELERLRKFPFLCIPNKNKSGLSITKRTARIYPYGDMARRSIGRVSESKETGEIHGLSGLECALDSLLYGKPGVTHKVALTKNLVNWVDKAPTDGMTLRTTINVNIQDMLEQELEKVLKTSQAEWGAAIIMETATGDIKAMVNLERNEKTGETYEAMNRLTQPVEPGSVVKLVGMIIALEDGIVKNTTQTIEQKAYNYHGTPVSDTHYDKKNNYQLQVEKILEFSSNIGITKVLLPHFCNDIPGWHKRVGELGLFDRFNTGIANEQVCRYANPKNGALGNLASQMFGYGTQLPPLYTCALYNAVANNGRFVRPRLVSAIRRPDGTDSVLPVTYHRDRICSEANAAILRRMLRRVIYEEGGTAKDVKSDLVEIAGKTGTAKIHVYLDPREPEKHDSLIRRYGPFSSPTGGYRPDKNKRVTFVGFFPYDNPQYTCLAIINDPATGGAQSTSGQVVKGMAEKLYSHGFIGNKVDYRSEAAANPQGATFYASTNGERRLALAKLLGIHDLLTFPDPKAPTANGGVPSVVGLGLREALVRLEEAGYHVKFNGTGYVANQQPAAGAAAKKGSTVTLTLRK